MSIDRENPDFNLNLERTKLLVSTKVSEIEASTQFVSSSGLLIDKWNSVEGNTDLPIYTYPQILLEAGFSETDVDTLLDLVRDLGIDVSDPHTSSSELSVIAGILSEDLIGADMTALRNRMDRVKLKSVDVFEGPLPPPPPDVVYVNEERALYHELNRIKKWQRALILSGDSYQAITRQLLEQNNQALQAITEGHWRQFWVNTGIPEDSKATIYFRDHKTYAGDVDFFYWGPGSEKYTLELSRYLMSLGYKVDHRSNILVGDLIKSEGKIDNGYLSAYLQMYFYMGKAIEINGDSFQEHYDNDVVPTINPDLA